MPKGVELKNIEILKVGVWNGQPVTRQRLRHLVEDFDEASRHLLPTLRLGHKAKQAFAKALFGEDVDIEAVSKDKGAWPALGHVTGVRLDGDLLFADFANVPPKLAKWIEDGRWPARSSAFWGNYPLAGKVFEAVLDHVALLGDETPAVDGLELIGLSNSGEHNDDRELFQVSFSAGEARGDKATDLDRFEAKIGALLDEYVPLIFGRKGAPRVRHSFGLSISEMRRVARSHLPRAEELSMKRAPEIAELLKLSKDVEPDKIAEAIVATDDDGLKGLVEFMSEGGGNFKDADQLVNYLTGALGVAPGDLDGIAGRIAEMMGGGEEEIDPNDPDAQLSKDGDPVTTKTTDPDPVLVTGDLTPTEKKLTAELVTLSKEMAASKAREARRDAEARVAKDEADAGITLPPSARTALVTLAASGNEKDYVALFSNTTPVPTGEGGASGGPSAADEPSAAEIDAAKSLGYSADDLRKFKKEEAANG